MSFIDIIILLVVALILLFAIKSLLKKENRCSGCSSKNSCKKCVSHSKNKLSKPK